MTIAHIVLLTGESEVDVLSRMLRQHNPELRITLASNRAALENALAQDLAATRLLSFTTPVIVPEEILRALPGPSYNFHPGPPDRPGRYPAVFALYEGAERFGVTVHEMTARVDAGPIVAADWFNIPDGADLAALESKALAALAKIFYRLSPFLALNPRPLPRIYIPWGGVKRTKAECEALCRVTAEMSDDDIARRERACGPLLNA